MTIEKLEECLEVFFDRKVYESLKAKLARFKDDSWLIEQLYSKIGEKDMRNLTTSDFITPVLAVDKIISADYPVKNVVQYSLLYRRAIEGNEFNRFSDILAHLNKVGQIEKSIPSEGIKENPEFGKKDGRGNIDKRPYLFEDSSYLGFMRQILDENQDTRKSIVSLDKRLASFETHLQNLKDEQIKIAELFSNGYTAIIKTLDSTQNKKEVDRFQETSQKVVELMKRLDSLGFNIYHNSSVAKINGWLGENKLEDVKLLSAYLSKEALMYVSALHLKND